MKYAKSNLCQLTFLSCFGCCGHHFKDKLSVAKGIEKNTLEYQKHILQKKPLKDFMNRTIDLRECGICRNMIYDIEKDKIYCPLHPELNNGEDIRIDHKYCDIFHVCKTAFFFELWGDLRKQEFLKFLRKKVKAGKLDWHSYSIAMANDSLLKEFEGLKWD